MALKLLVLLLVGIVVVLAGDDPVASMPGVVDLTVSNIESTLRDKDYLVEFYAPWCGWCKRIAPVWTELGQKVGSDNPTVGVAKFDATQSGADDIKTTYAIRGFPTIVLIKRDGTTLRYQEERSAEALLTWLSRNTDFKLDGQAKAPASEGTEPSSTPSQGTQPTAGQVVVLTPENFDSIVKDEQKIVFVKFYAPWCGHCVRMADAWKDVAKAVKDVPDVVIAELDAAAHANEASSYGVRGFPTIKLFPKDDKSGDVTYRGGRDTSSFLTFLKQHGVDTSAPQA
jgi:protein disulfide-isomerase A6